ncbi:MAG TPA: 23S rRNA (adenine(1618)-N(6))-methyltransferase RlmF [Bacteroidia bacterium]|jgi:23S rRNA (adenine1618-N6)-methyltransferase
MKKSTGHHSLEKENLHPRNRHRTPYDFDQLIAACKELKSCVYINEHGVRSIDFSDPGAVKILNKALLKRFYDVSDWNIPEGYLCPAIPGRADYIHYAADLLSSCNNGVLPEGGKIKVLDVGTGASCVYPLIGVKEYNWNFIGSDTDQVAVASAQRIIQSNPALAGKIELRLQDDPNAIFKNVLKPGEVIDMSVCNPPFHPSAEAAAAGSERKVRNLGDSSSGKPILNFGGQNNELWFKGGEASFIYYMIMESAQLKEKCLWFTSLVSRKESLAGIYKTLEKVEAAEVRTINTSQGQKKSRIVAWSFLGADQQKRWCKERWK